MENNILYNTIRRDADTALSQAILYLITGNPQYRTNALTSETVPPTLQFAGMGRDMSHSLCDIAVR